MLRSSIVLVVFLAACAHAPGHAGSSQEILDVIQELFDAMATGDSERAAAVLLPEGQWVSVRPRDDGAGVVAVMPHQDFIARLGEAGEAGERWIERIWDPEVLVHGPIAVVWTPYDFSRDDVFSHCGMDAFTLVRTADGWRIAGATYTVETTC